MGYSLDEFAGNLPAAMRDWVVRGGPPRWEVSEPDGTPVAIVSATVLPVRSIGSLRVPALGVSIAWRTRSVALVAEFERRFERGFHRGGG